MAFVTGDVVAVSGDELPFKVIFKQGETVLTEWLVETKEDGELQIVETLKGLVDDDEEEEGDDEDCELRQNSTAGGGAIRAAASGLLFEPVDNFVRRDRLALV